MALLLKNEIGCGGFSQKLGLTFAAAFHVLSFISRQHCHRMALVDHVEGPRNLREHVETELKLNKGVKECKS